MSEKMQKSAVTPGIFLGRHFAEELVRLCLDALPNKAFGLVGGLDVYHPQNLYPCSTNLRNEPEWRSLFESFGEFYKNPDLGFVISPPEVKAVVDTMVLRRELLVGVFHSHRYLGALPSEIDIALNSDTGLLSYIVSVANLSDPEIGVFRINGNGYQNIPIVRGAS